MKERRIPYEFNNVLGNPRRHLTFLTRERVSIG
jgi:hypothetical protein